MFSTYKYVDDETDTLGIKLNSQKINTKKDITYIKKPSCNEPDNAYNYPF